MPTNAMGRDPQRPGNTGASSGGPGTNAAKDRAAVSGMTHGTSDLAKERSRLRALGADFVTPKYGWDDASLSDFGISGGLMNAFQGLLAGNTYAGRMPQGLKAGFASNSKGGFQYPAESGASDLDIERMLLTGGYGGANRAVYTPDMKGMPQVFADAMNPKPAAPQSLGLMFKPQTYQPQQANIPGALDYGVKFDPWKYFA